MPREQVLRVGPRSAPCHRVQQHGVGQGIGDGVRYRGPADSARAGFPAHAGQGPPRRPPRLQPRPAPRVFRHGINDDDAAGTIADRLGCPAVQPAGRRPRRRRAGRPPGRRKLAGKRRRRRRHRPVRRPGRPGRSGVVMRGPPPRKRLSPASTRRAAAGGVGDREGEFQVVDQASPGPAASRCRGRVRRVCAIRPRNRCGRRARGPWCSAAVRMRAVADPAWT